MIVDKNKQQLAELVVHTTMKTLVHQLQDEADHDTDIKFSPYPSLCSQFNAGGYTTQAAEMYGDIFNHTTLEKSFSKPPEFEMMLFGIEPASAFPPLLAPTSITRESKTTIRRKILNQYYRPITSNDISNSQNKNDTCIRDESGNK